MPFIGKVAVGAPTFDHQTDSYDVTVDLIVLGLDYAFLKKDDQIIGIVCVDSLLEEFNSAANSEAKVAEFMEPLISISEYEHKLKTAQLMRENKVEHIAVTNRAGDFVGIASFKQLKTES